MLVTASVWDSDSEWLLAEVLKRGGNPNARYENNATVLEQAFHQKRWGAVRILLQHGAQANTYGANGQYLLSYAAWSDTPLDVVKLFLEKGADPSVKEPSSGKTVLELAVEAGKPELVALLAPRVAQKEQKAILDKARAEAAKREAEKVLAQARGQAQAQAEKMERSATGTPDAVPPAPGYESAPVARERRPKPERPPVVAVFDVELRGVSLGKDTAANLSELIAIQLVETGYFQVVPREDLRRRINQAKAETHRECFDEACQIELGKDLAAEQTLSIKVMKLGGECSSTLTLFDLKRATGVAAVTAVSACGEREIIKAFRALVDRLTY